MVPHPNDSLLHGYDTAGTGDSPRRRIRPPFQHRPEIERMAELAAIGAFRLSPVQRIELALYMAARAAHEEETQDEHHTDA